MIEFINSYGDRVIEYSKDDYLKAIIRYGSEDKASHMLNVCAGTIRQYIPMRICSEYIRKPPVITSEFNHYVMRSW